MIHPDLFAAVMAKKKPPSFQRISEPELFKSQNLADTPESDISSSMESGTTFTSDEDCYSSAVSSSDTLPSPEIFRREDNGVCMYVCARAHACLLALVCLQTMWFSCANIWFGFTFPSTAETATFCIKAQHLHPVIKNSTLLDGSCAQNIHMQNSPDLSVINSKWGGGVTSFLLVPQM